MKSISFSGATLAAVLLLICQSAAAEAQFLPGTLLGMLDDFRGIETSGLIPTLDRAIATQITTFPIGSSSGGFTFGHDVDPVTLGPARSSQGFGPAFAERALPIGFGRVSVGFNYQRVKYEKFENQDLTNLVLGPQSAMAFAIQTNTLALFANVGVHDRVDVGVAVPFSTIDVDAQFYIVAPTGRRPLVHRQGTANGLGDILVRAKYNVLESNGGGFAIASDLRLPSGDADNFLGTGRAQLKLFAVASGEMGRVAPHVNVGYRFDLGAVELGNVGRVTERSQREIPYTGGVEILAGKKVTIVGDVIGRYLQDTDRFGVNASGILRQTPESALNLLLGAAGVKVNVGSTLLINAHLLFPLNSAGLTSGFSPVFGLDYAF